MTEPVDGNELERRLARYRPLIDDWAAFREALARPLPTCLAVNTERVTPAALRASLAEGGYDARPLHWTADALRVEEPGFRAGARWEFLGGLYQVQEEVSLLPVAVLDPRPGERVLDLCAAPGSKTTRIALALGNRGTVIANDRNAARLRAVQQAIKRLGLANVTTTSADGAAFPRAAGSFDKVLVDAPCTCEGTSRKNPRVLRELDDRFAAYCVGTQRALLRRALALCRPGGRIVYATCTYAPEENEAVVDGVLREYGDDALRLASAHVPGVVGAAGLTEWDGGRFHPSLAQALRVWPHHNDTGGFFVAAIDKLEPTGDEPVPGEWQVRALAEAAEPGWAAWLDERYGVGDALAGSTVFAHGRRYVQLAADDHAPSAVPRPDTIGLPLAHVQMRYPKITTAAALAFASQASRNVVDLDADQARRFLERQTVQLDQAQCVGCERRGYLLVRFRGYGLGAGDYRASGEGGGTLHSLYPKAWAPAHGAEVTAPDACVDA